MDFRRMFGILCESFGGEVEEDEALTCIFSEGEHESFKAFATWLHRNAVRGKKKGAFSAKWEGTSLQGGKVVEELFVENGRGKFEFRIEDSLGSYESNADWVEDILDEEGIDIDLEELDLSKAYDEAGRAVTRLNYREVTKAPPYIFMRGDVRCETESDFDYDVENLVCYGEVEVDESVVLSSVMDDVEKAVEKAAESARDVWHDTFRDKVIGLARRLVAR